jgi:hypothetical protein
MLHLRLYGKHWEPTLVAIRGKPVILDDVITLTALILDDRFKASATVELEASSCHRGIEKRIIAAR